MTFAIDQQIVIIAAAPLSFSHPYHADAERRAAAHRQEITALPLLKEYFVRVPIVITIRKRFLRPLIKTHSGRMP